MHFLYKDLAIKELRKLSPSTIDMLKALPDDVEGMRSFVEKCRDEDGGYSLAPAEQSNVVATYFASMIHHWLKGKKKTKEGSRSRKPIGWEK